MSSYITQGREQNIFINSHKKTKLKINFSKKPQTISQVNIFTIKIKISNNLLDIDN